VNNKPTIHDIAKALSIDSSTVSRALNGSDRVTQATKKKVLEKAEEMGYQRNLLASNLRRNVTNTIGVVVPRISRHFFSSAIQGVEETAYELGYNVMICQSLEQLEREMKIINGLVSNRVDGLLISISMETLNYNHLEIVKKSGTPVIFFDRHCEIPGYNNVVTNDFKAGYDATQHLISQGCKNIVHFSGPQELVMYKNRFQGYKAALEENNIPFNKEYIIFTKLMEEDGYTSMSKLLESNLLIDAVFSANDVSAIGAMKCIKERGLKIPNDIAIVGFSNEPVSRIIEPALSTMQQSGFEIGKIATALLMKHIKEKNVKIEEQTILLDSNLIVRNSSKKNEN